MPRFTPYTAGQLRRAHERLAEASYTPVAELTVRAWRTPEPVPYAQRETGQVLDLKPGDIWGDLFDCAWFRFTGTVPEAVRDDAVVLLLDVHGEMCVVDADGAPWRGLTTVSSVFDLSLGQPGKRVLPWYPDDDAGTVDLWADAGCNDLFGNLQGNGTLREARIAVCHEDVRALAFDAEVLLDFLDVLDEEGPRHHQVRRALTEVARLLDSPAALEHGPSAPGAAHQRRGPRTHGPGVAVADPRDDPQGSADLRHGPGALRALPRLRLRRQPTPVLPVDEGALPGSVGPHSRRRARRASRDPGLHVGGSGHQHLRGRGAGAPDPAGPAFLAG
jgi:hypothetical protein